MSINSMIYNPLKEYLSTFKALHLKNTEHFLDELIKKSGIDIEENRKTVKQYEEFKELIAKLKKKYNWLRFLRVVMIITLVLIPLVILKTTPKIKALREEIKNADTKIDELLSLAKSQVAPLNALFSDRDSLNIIESVIPLISFAPYFSSEQESNMAVNYDFNFSDKNNREQSTLEVLSGSFNENPFVFERRLTHRMGEEVYHGYKTIHWTERYRGSDGKMHTRTRTQTLHATLVKPKPFYSTKLLLHYCTQGGPELSFTRDASHLHEKNERELEKHVKRGEKKLKKMTDEAIKNNSDFTSMSNSDFEVLFDALDRTNEVQYRTLFTPLAQTNMVDLITSKDGFGDDFNFIKRNRTNTIVAEHSQSRSVVLRASCYASHSFDIIKDNFTKQNEAFFKAVYFDLAPILAIPIYQERPVHSLDPIPDLSKRYSRMECESLTNATDKRNFTHPATKTQTILKSTYLSSSGDVDEINVDAYSYDIINRIDFVPVYGGDGRWHNVPVQWDDYIPLEASNKFFVASSELAKDKNVLGRNNGICIFN